MITRLFIKNYILIDSLEISFDTDFSVITGETGAGKSILLDAIGLLTGNRADMSLVRPNADKCIIEATFKGINDSVLSIFEENDIEKDCQECIIRREITSKGKSRSFVNDTPVALSVLKEIGEHLIDIHSQHKNLLLGSTLFQLSVIDIYSNNNSLLKEYKELFIQYNKKKNELNNLLSEVESQKKEREYIEYQLQQLTDASLVENEEQSLFQEQELLSNAMDIKESLCKTINSIDNDQYGAMYSLGTAIHEINSIKGYSDDFNELHERINSVLIELKDIYRELSRQEGNVAFSPERLSEIESRLDTINKLLLKHRADNTSQLIAIQHDLENKLFDLDNSSQAIDKLNKEVNTLFDKLHKLAENLHETRVVAIPIIEKKLIDNLKNLGIPHIRLKIDIEKLDGLSSNGYDKVEILFSANKEMSLEPVASIASGGEISRLMLCIKALIADKRNLPTIIFDEIDTGVSGDIADKIGIILKNMGKTMQVMAVTHLPQIAACGNRHIYVYKEHGKDVSSTNIVELENDERVMEIARMQSGNNLTDVSLAAAKELLNKCK